MSKLNAQILVLKYQSLIKWSYDIKLLPEKSTLYTRVPAWLSTTLFPIQLLAIAPGKQSIMAHVLEFMPHRWETYEFFYFSFKDSFIFIWRIDVQTEEEKEREIFHLLTHFSNGCSGQSWANLKLGVKSQELLPNFPFGYWGSRTFLVINGELNLKWNSWE